MPTSKRTATAPPAQPIARLTLATATLQALRDRILRGGLAVGEPLRQDALAEELGVSRIPVREALRQLEAEGLVTFSPHRGAVVSSFSADEIEELFELRALVESDLLARAVPRLTAPDLERAAEALEAYGAAVARQEVGSYGALNWQFHSTLYAAAGRPVTMGVVERLNVHADRYMRMQLTLTHGESRADQEHRAILRACKAGDADRASRALATHVLGAGASLARFLRRDARSATPRIARPASPRTRPAGTR